MNFEDYKMSVVGYLVTWDCNKQWAINQLFSREDRIRSFYDRQLAAENCAKELAGY